MEQIKGKIAAIVSSSGVVINRGKKDAVIEGMVFLVELVLPTIVDPDDPENKLEGLSFEKGRLQVTTVLESMSYAVILPRGEFTVASLFAGESRPEVADQKVHEKDWIIRVGDRVRSIPESKEKQQTTKRG